MAVSSLPKAKPVPAFSRRTIVTVAAPTARHAVRQAIKPQHHLGKTLAIIMASVASVAVAAVLSLGNLIAQPGQGSFFPQGIEAIPPSVSETPTTQHLITTQDDVLEVTQGEAPEPTLATSDPTQTSTPPATTPPAGSESAHWADVNLEEQTVTLMDGYIPTSTFVLSSGAPGHPTPTGVFHVYAKVFAQSLSGCVDGDCYYYPNVHWATWFYEDYGFHEAYWNEDFGTPVSHGCLNLTYSDAQAVYDWLSISDAVYVH